MTQAKAISKAMTEPVLAQIPAGAPGRAYWFGIGALIWALWFGLLAALSHWAGFFPGPPRADVRFLLGGAVALAAPILSLPWLQVFVMRRLGAPARLDRCGARGLPVAGRPLPRRAALLVLLLPQLALILLGLAAMALGWFWAPVFVATTAAAATPERSLAARLRRERGCTQVDFRREGVVLYGTGRPVRPVPLLSLWLTSLLMGAGWMVVALVAGRGLIEAAANAALALQSPRLILLPPPPPPDQPRPR